MVYVKYTCTKYIRALIYLGLVVARNFQLFTVLTVLIKL